MTKTVRPPGRPLDATVDAAVLAATQELLVEQGFDRLSVDSVAARAGVGKASIYRRWPGKTPLVVAAVADLAHRPPVPNTGSLRQDLLACGRAYMQTGRTGQIMVGLMTAMMHQQELRVAARSSVGAPFQELFHLVITRAMENGAAAATADAVSISEVFPALAFHRVAVLGLSVDDQFVARVVDHLLLPLLLTSGETTDGDHR